MPKLPIAKDGLPPYAIHVTERPDGFELHIPELLLTVRAASLQEAYDRLVDWKREVLEQARAAGVMEELPPAADPPGILRTTPAAHILDLESLAYGRRRP